MEQGRLRGVEQAGVVRFRGIPYAEAERFALPTPARAWQGIHDATAPGPICPQPPSPLDDVMGKPSPAQQSEECLTLGITAPAQRARPLPVMVWLHGGAYLIGAGSHDWYDGAALALEGDVIVVQVNYRLGVFGYLHWPGVSPPNLGVHDQIAALRWIAHNIAAFGGDPQRITLFGQSAGGHSIATLMSTRATRGLFQRAIIQSAHLGVGFTTRVGAARVAGQLQAALAGDDPRRCSVERLLAAQNQMRLRHAGPAGLNLTPPYGPIAGLDPLPDAAQLTRSPSALSPHVDMIIGTVRDELRSLFEVNPHWRRLRQIHPLGATLFNGAAAVLGRAVFHAAARQLADRQARAGADVFTYELHWSPPHAALGACHVIDLPFVFGGRAAWEAAPMLGGRWDEVDAVGRAMRSAWTHFAHGGNPNAATPGARAAGGRGWPKHVPGAATGRVFR